MFGAQLGVVFAYSALIVLTFMVIWIIVVPFKAIRKILLNVVLGIVCIMIYNLVGNYLSFEVIGINSITATTVALLGVPGFIAIAVIKSVL